MEDIKITRCPSCGSVHLEGVYDNSGTKKVGKKMIISTLLGFGLIGAISSINDVRKGTGAYWRCQDCGNTFPM